MEAKRSLSLLRTLIKNPSLSSKFCSSAAANKTPNKKWEVFTENQAKTGPKRPKTVQWREQICNSASFVGTVIRPVKKFDMPTGQYGACTSLLVKPPSNPHRPFRILLKMWDEMADISLEHIKQNDFLHVSGRVESYRKTDENNTLQTFYEVIVKEIHYVAECEHSPTRTKVEQVDSAGDSPLRNQTARLTHVATGPPQVHSESATDFDRPTNPNFSKTPNSQLQKGESGFEKSQARLRLWQLIFTNPSEWSDFRTKKTKPNHPDFKRTDTGEALWINPRDPPWVKKQLQLLDSNSKKQENKQDSTSSFSTFV